MKIKRVKIKNFRGYKDEVEINFNDLTVFVGKNDIGKSTVLEALDIFFNEGNSSNGVIKIDKDDINKQGLGEGNNIVEISVVFDEFPEEIIIDSTNPTSLADEYLLNSQNELEIIKKFPNAGKAKVYIKANHPTGEGCDNLLLKKQADLRNLISDGEIECENRSKNAIMRSAIWRHHAGNLELDEIEIDASKEDAKNIWEKLKESMPLYALFQSDRKNSDGDSEVQDPLKFAVEEILKDPELTRKLNEVAVEVQTKLTEVADGTLAKLNEMNPDIANSLTPQIPEYSSLKWKDVFKNVSISGDDGIPINKRGSGVKRLILVNFFRAEAERRRQAGNMPSIVYAIEEPETSQHTEHQKLLIKALIELSEIDKTQILLTTHSSVIVKELQFNHLRLIKEEGGNKTIDSVQPSQLPYPSLNEVNFAAFGEVSEEYHNELYGYIEEQLLLGNYRAGKPTILYNRQQRDGNIVPEQKILTEYIRHQIHHPENQNNPRYTHVQLSDSIRMMRDFIIQENAQLI